MKEEIIEINLTKKDDYINNYNKNKLSDNLREYILEEVKATDPKKKINFIITHEFEMSDEEKNQFVNMIRSCFGINVSEIIKISKKANVINWIMFFIGMLFLIMYYFINKEIALTEIILIMGWIFIWESTYNALSGNIETKLKVKRRKQIIASKIKFNQKNST